MNVTDFKFKKLRPFFFFGLSVASTSFFFTTHCNTTIKVQKSQDFFTFQVGRPDIVIDELQYMDVDFS